MKKLKEDFEFAKQRELEDLANDVVSDFKKRQQRRKPFENQWQLNMNFLMGNQYCYINGLGEVEDCEKQYFWQEREVFNHIAPIIESRISKLNKIRPKMSVVPSTNSEKDISIAKISKNLINATYHKLSISDLITKATVWSEICGTVIYKVGWDALGGKKIGVDSNGKGIFEGEIFVEICSPFEFFVDSNSAQDIDNCRSVIHARCLHIDEIKEKWGVEVESQRVNAFSLDSANVLGGLGYDASALKIINEEKTDHAIVIERYESCSEKHPNGVLTIVCGNKVLYNGELPYINSKKGTRGFPFVRQVCCEQAGCFWGKSIIERIIPIQRAYNSVKNRKHEFLNRLCMGILTVEDGSVDIDNLEEEGLSPGKVLVYRQGSTPPNIMETIKMPAEFSEEEEKLLNEFVLVSGVSDLMTKSSVDSTKLSGTALQVLYEQDNNRLLSSTENIKNAIKNVANFILRLYKQFISVARMCKTVGKDGSIDMFYFSASDITSDDIVYETENELGETLTQKRNMIFELLNCGLLHNENGKLSNRIRNKTLEMLGFGIWDSQYDLDELHMRRAGKENLNILLSLGKVEVLEVDDHNIHIDEHIAFMLGEDFSKKMVDDSKIKINMLKHIAEHKILLKNANENSNIKE